MVGRRDRGRRLPTMLTAGMVFILPLVVGLMVLHEPTVSSPDGSGYFLDDPVIDTDLHDRSSEVSITREGLVRYSRTSEGLRCVMRVEGDTVQLNLGAVSSIALTLNISDLVRHHWNTAIVEFRFYDGPSLVSVQYGIGMYNTSVTYMLDNGSFKETVYSDLLLDRPEDADMMVIVTKNGIRSGINGVEESHPFELLDDFKTQRAEVRISAGNGINSQRDVHIFRLQASNHAVYRYIDTLHKTIVPNGKDMAFSLHIHADKAFIQQFEVMANLSNEFGLKGTYDAWWKGNSQQYGMESPEYVAALHALKDSGWDIGIHAGSVNDMTREQVIAAIENISSEFGEVRTWSDHGYRQQSMLINGTNASSAYYVKDLIIDIGAGWWHNNAHSHSKWNDLNREGMNYTLLGQEEVPLFRVSRQQALKLYFENGRQANVSTWIRALPVQRSVFVAHDYLPFFCYVSNGTGNYSVLPAHDGIANSPWSSLRPKLDFPDGTWHPLPSFVELLNTLKGYDVWFTTVRDVYDRSCLIQKVTLKEEDGRITITNHNGVPVRGLTIYTRGNYPSYDIQEGDVQLPFQQGTGNSWHIVIDLEPGEVKVLKVMSKEPISTFLDTKGQVMLAIRETWPDS